ncbi:MAG: hypothetical protein ACK559_22010, partial [bacterium]
GAGSVSVTATGETVIGGVVTGTINAGGRGIFAYNSLNDVAATVGVTNNQVIKSGSLGIFARSAGGDVTVVNKGEIASGSSGITADSSKGGVSIDNAGVIQAQNGQGIVARAAGDVTIANTKSI